MKKVICSSLLIATLFTACGGESYKEDTDVTGTGSGATGGTTVTDGTTTTVTPSEAEYPALQYSFTITGNDGTTESQTFTGIDTDNILQIKVKPGAASNLSLTSGTSNFSASYYCASYSISVLGQTVQTDALALTTGGAGPCQGAATEQIIDFSGRLTSGHDAIEVVVSGAKYDYYCQLLYMGWIPYSYYATYCGAGLYPTYKNHTMTGTIEVMVNGTAFSD